MHEAVPLGVPKREPVALICNSEEEGHAGIPGATVVLRYEMVGDWARQKC